MLPVLSSFDINIRCLSCSYSPTVMFTEIHTEIVSISIVIALVAVIY